MADAAPKSEGRKGARKHTGLGRGLGALIPQASEQTPQNSFNCVGTLLHVKQWHALS